MWNIIYREFFSEIKEIDGLNENSENSEAVLREVFGCKNVPYR